MMNEYQKFIHLSRYARWDSVKNRRETWEETVQRYVDYFGEKFPGKYPTKRVYDAIVNLKAVPSMRALMTAGPALERDPMAGYNCLSGNTLVTTKEYGITKISGLAGQEVHVVDGNGNWTLAKCNSYGKQKLMSFIVKQSGPGEGTKFESTKNHRWILRNGTEKITAELKEGDQLASINFPIRDKEVDHTNVDYRQGIQHGLVYGDGTRKMKQSSGCLEKNIRSQKICSGFSIQLCGDVDDLLPYFDGYTRSYPKSYGGQPVVYLNDVIIDIKDVPAVETKIFNNNYLLGFLRGWIAADGSVGKNGGAVTLATNKSGVDWVNTNGPRLGFVPLSITQYPNETNFGLRSEPLFCITFDRRWLYKEDFIISRKAERFVECTKYAFGKISAVQETNKIEEVFCFDVPTTHSFLLTKNILTGNCSFVAVDHPRVFDEIMYILMCGTGVGFSVERQFVASLPVVSEEFFNTETTITVADSKMGWASAFREIVSLLYSGRVPKWDVSKVRKAGEKLKTFGGRASGPEPLVELFKFTCSLFQKAAGRKLNSVECHDLICKVAEVVVVGGVRRSALISLSNLTDERMRNAKNGQWWETEVQRALANNSVAYTEKPDIGIFMREWLSLYDSKSGERGIFNRVSAVKKAKENGRRNYEDYPFGTNPCGEILLRPNGLCNLSEVIVRDDDTLETLLEKVEIATIIGTFQSTLVDFRYVRGIWRKNAEEERLLGVSLTGIMDNRMLSGQNGVSDGGMADVLTRLKERTIAVNKEWSSLLGIEPSAAITTVKPSGTVSQLVDSASGIHPRYSDYYIRTVRSDKKDPLAILMKEANVPVEDDVTKPDSTWVFAFPQKAPKGSVMRNDMSAIQQLEHYLIFQKHWCEHNPSITVYVRESEWMDVGAWVYKNFDNVGGVSFLPFSDHAYRQAPYQECTKEEYEAAVKAFPVVDWSKLSAYEKTDETTGSQELSCMSASGCEIL